MKSRSAIVFASATALVGVFLSGCESLTGIDAATWNAAFDQTSRNLAASNPYLAATPGYASSSPSPFYHSAGTGPSPYSDPYARGDDSTSTFAEESDEDDEREIAAYDHSEEDSDSGRDDGESDLEEPGGGRDSYAGEEERETEESGEDAYSVGSGSSERVGRSSEVDEPERPTALIVTWQTKAKGFWRAGGPVQWILVGGQTTEEEAMENAYTTGAPRFLGTVTGTLDLGDGGIGSGEFRVYSLDRPLESYEVDVRDRLTGLPD